MSVGQPSPVSLGSVVVSVGSPLPTVFVWIAFWVDEPLWEDCLLCSHAVVSVVEHADTATFNCECSYS